MALAAAGGPATDVDGVVVAAYVAAIRCAEGLATVIDGIGSIRNIDAQRQATPNINNWREGPSAQQVPNEAMLALEERWLVDEEGIEQEFTIPGLQPVASAEVEGIIDCVLASSLDLRS